MRNRTEPNGVPTFTVEQIEDEFVYRRPSSTQILKMFDRKRAVLETARGIGKALGVKTMRVVIPGAHRLTTPPP
jgi:hypothetical protein